MAFRLINSEDVKMLTKGGGFEPDHDVLLDNLIIPAIGEIFASYCNRPDFDKKLRTEYLTPKYYSQVLQVSSPPIAVAAIGPPEIPAVELWEDVATPRAYGADTLLTEGDDYFIYRESGQIHRINYWPAYHNAVKIVYTGGYATDHGQNVPFNLKLAAVEQAKIIFDRREELSVISRSLEGGSVSMLSALTLPQQVKIKIDPYKVYR
jgi:hypothetical protein